MAAIKGVIFDYGGTLDSRGEHWSHIIRRGYRAAGVDVGEKDFKEAYVHAERALAKKRYIEPHHTFRALMEIKIRIELEFLEDNGVVAPGTAASHSGEIAAYCDDYARECTVESRQTLETLRKAGVPMVLVSNFYGNVNSVLADYGLCSYFKAVIESAVVGVRKPDPAIFALGVEDLGLCPHEVLVVGDSMKKDIIPAASLGCNTVRLVGNGWDDDESSAEVSAMSIHKLSEVCNLPLLNIHS
ncbi:MAG: HAD family hydrolase [Paramuribaculum sp.]|nr:HAD family hydrolase [Paramuribaculum sp.]